MKLLGVIFGYVLALATAWVVIFPYLYVIKMDTHWAHKSFFFSLLPILDLILWAGLIASVGFISKFSKTVREGLK